MRLMFAAASTSLIVLAAACGASGENAQNASQSQTGQTAGSPLENRPANNPDQKPAFTGQTRAPGVVTRQPLTHTVIASGLEHPWGLAALPDGRWLVTEKPGRIRIVSAQGALSAPIAGLPPVDARGQGGLLDVIVSPSFAQDRMVYWSYSEPRQGGNATSVARGKLSEDGSRLEAVQVIFRALPVYDGDKHFGSSLAFAPSGHLFITLGERSDRPMRPQAQDL
ncbi:hypothetical protein LTR94_028789, partial [Friedmanniomyces endolithicus]